MAQGTGRNWWKIGFFVLLFFAEVAREILVLAWPVEAEPIVHENVLTYEGYAGATGIWRRTDGGDLANIISLNLDCYRERGECYEAAYSVDGLTVFQPSLNIYPATFTDEAVTFTDASPVCTSYSTRIDLKSKKVTRVRVNKLLVADDLTPEMKELCETSEDRLEMELSGYKIQDAMKKRDEGFVPVIAVARAMLSVF